MTFVLTAPCPTCGARLRVHLDTDGHGRLEEHVEPCATCTAPPKRRAWTGRVNVERRRAAICQLCDAPVTGKPKVALYCDDHRRQARAQAQEKHRAKVGNKHSRAYYARHRDKVIERERARYQNDPEVRRRRNEYKRQWRKLNRDKVRAQKRRAALRRGGDTPESIRRWRKEVEAGIRTPKRARRNARGERLCLTPDCPSVMRGHAKKCEACKQRDRAIAAAELRMEAA